MSGMIVRWTCTIMVVLAFGSAVRAEPQQRHILDAAINLGWATEHVARYGNSPEIRPHVAQAMENAQAHVRALVALPEPPYAQLDFSRFLEMVANWETAVGMGALMGSGSIYGMYERLRGTVSYVFDGRTRTWGRGNSCDEAFVEVGYWFGRGHVAGLHKDHFERRQHLWRMRGAIDQGLELAARTGCAFGTDADWARLPAENDDPTPEDFGATLTRIQEIALGARADTPDHAPDPPAGRCIDLVGVTREDQLGGTMGSDADLTGPTSVIALRAVAPYGQPVQFDIRWTSLPRRICVGQPFDIAMQIDNRALGEARAPGVSIGVVVNSPQQFVTISCTNPNPYQAMLVAVDGGERAGANTCTLRFDQIPDVALAQRWLIRVRMVAAVGGEGWLWYEYQ